MKKTILLLASIAVAMVLVSGVALAAPKEGDSGSDTGSTKNDSITVIFNGEEITVTIHEGTSGNDTIIGTTENDLIKGYGGDDHLYGDDPSQSVGGKDAIGGGTGDDVISGGPNSDALAGGSGNDQLKAADGAKDWVYCGEGVDTVEADSADVLYNCESVSYPS